MKIQNIHFQSVLKQICWHKVFGFDLIAKNKNKKKQIHSKPFSRKYTSHRTLNLTHCRYVVFNIWKFFWCRFLFGGEIFESPSRNQLGSELRHFTGAEVKSPIWRGLRWMDVFETPSLGGKTVFRFFFKLYWCKSGLGLSWTQIPRESFSGLDWCRAPNVHGHVCAQVLNEPIWTSQNPVLYAVHVFTAVAFLLQSFSFVGSLLDVGQHISHQCLLEPFPHTVHQLLLFPDVFISDYEGLA